jgi:hypothetical protein
MTSPDRDLDGVIRQALHALADPIEPAADGLARIRQRITRPWPQRQAWLLFTECADLLVILAIRCEPLAAWVRSGFGAARVALAAAYRHRPRRLLHALRVAGSTAARAHPAVAVAGVVALVAAGIFGLTHLQQLVSPGAYASRPTGGPGGSPSAEHTAASRAGGHSQAVPLPSVRPSASHRDRARHRPVAPQASCSPTPSASPTATLSPSPSATPTPSPSATPVPTPTPTVTVALGVAGYLPGADAALVRSSGARDAPRATGRRDRCASAPATTRASPVSHG